VETLAQNGGNARELLSMKLFTRYLFTAAVFAATAAFTCAAAEVTRADRERAWETQARGIAKAVNQPADSEEKMVLVYVETRGKVQDFVESLESKGEDIHKHLDEYRKVTGEEREKLKTSFSEFMTEEDSEIALSTLGTFSRQWDRTVLAYSKYELDSAKQEKAFSAAAEYAKAIDAARKKAMDGGDTKAMTADFDKAGEKLNAAMAEIFSADQLATFKSDTAIGQAPAAAKEEKIAPSK
jgi:hypothetical protein